MKKLSLIGIVICTLWIGTDSFGQYGGPVLEAQRNAIRRHNIDQTGEQIKENRSAEYKVDPNRSGEYVVDPESLNKAGRANNTSGNVSEGDTRSVQSKSGLSFSTLSERIKKNKPVTPTSSKKFKVKRLRRSFKGMADRIKKKEDAGPTSDAKESQK